MDGKQGSTILTEVWDASSRAGNGHALSEFPRLVSVRAGEVSISFRHSFTDEDSPQGHLRCGRPALTAVLFL